MKGLKGMQKRLYLFLMLSAGIIVASTLDSRRSGGTRKRAPLDFSNSSSLSHVATLNDIVLEAPNSAFLPSEDDIIEYQAVALNEVENTSPVSDIVDEIEEENVISEPIVLSSVDEKKVNPVKVIPPKKEVKKVEKKISSLRNDELKTKAPQTNAFHDVVVKEGEEVLISVSEKEENLPEENHTEKIPVKTTVKRPPLPPAINEKDFSKVSSENISEDVNPFGVSVKNLSEKDLGIEKRVKNSVEFAKSSKRKADISFGQSENPFVKAFSSIKPEKTDDVVAKKSKKKKEQVVSSLSPKHLKADLYHTYISDNQYLSPVEYYDDEEEFLEDEVDEEFIDEAEETAEQYAEDEDFAEEKNVGDALEGDVGPVDVNKIQAKFQNAKKSANPSSGPLKVGNREVLQMKLEFEPNSSAISGESVNIIRSFAQIATDQPTNSIQIAIAESAMKNPKAKKLAARRLAIVSNVLRNAGLSDKQINPVLTNRDIDSFSFRVMNNDNYEKLRVSKGTDIFGEEENVKEYNLMRW